MNPLTKVGLSRSMIELLVNDPNDLRQAIARLVRAMAPLLHPDTNTGDDRTKLLSELNAAVTTIDGSTDDELVDWAKELVGDTEKGAFSRGLMTKAGQESVTALERQLSDLRQEFERSRLEEEQLLQEERYLKNQFCVLLRALVPKRAWPEKEGTSVLELLDHIFLRRVRFLQGKTEQARQDKLVMSVEYQLLYLDLSGQVWIDARTLKFSPESDRRSSGVETQMRPQEMAEQLFRSQILKDLIGLRNGVFGTATKHGLVLGFHSGAHSTGGPRRQGSHIRTAESISGLVEQASQTIRIEDATQLVTVRPLSLPEQKKMNAERAKLPGISTERRNVPQYIIELVPFEPINPWNPNRPS